ncbi:protoporphyrinogen oxidase [Calliopsis andreniformis]|uniref:protoporphyrinogen oxidase n=1 Tax=Calliopsis andreniformis TaxID=337506 RepID=UPI003FCE0218
MTAILGAGMSGLSAAYYALENSKLASISILEASNRVGGWVRSKKLRDGTVFEQGPRTIRVQGLNGRNTLELVEQLGLSDKIIPITNSNLVVKSRLIYADNQLHVVPTNLIGIIRKNTLLKRSVLSIIWNEINTPTISKDDESIHSFVTRRLGQDVADKVISPIVCGIFAGDAHKISVKSLAKSIFEIEQKHGSIIKGLALGQLFKNEQNQAEKNNILNVNNNQKSLVNKAQRESWSIWGMKGGLEQLPEALANSVTKRGVKLKMGHKCEQLKFHEDHVELTINGKIEKYYNVISSLPAKDLANLVQEQHPQLSKELREIPTVTVGVVNLQFRQNVLPLNAFGILIAPKEEIPILGIILDSCVLPQNSQKTVLTVMMGGAWFEKYFGKCSSEEHLLTVAVDQVREILEINEDPQVFNVSILKDCIPQHIVGHMQRLTRIRDYISTHKIPLGLCGSSYQGVGLNDVILSAKQAVSDISLNI